MPHGAPEGLDVQPRPNYEFLMTLLYFLAACAGLVLFGWTVSKITGAKAHYIEDWQFEAGEQVLWRDEAADIFLLAHYGRALYESFARPRRGMVVVTDRRILAGARPLFGKKHLLQYMLYPVGSLPPSAPSTPEKPVSSLEDTRRLHGGLFTKGYQTILLQPGPADIHATGQEKNAFVDLTPAPDAASSTNLQAVRIFTDQAASFRLPGAF